MKIIIIILLTFNFIYSSNIILDNETGFIWQDDKNIGTNYETWLDAKNFCSILVLEGKRNWRLPSTKELKSIVDTKNTPTVKDGFNNTVNYYYWSADSLDALTALVVSFDTGKTLSYSKLDYASIRCVTGKSVFQLKKEKERLAKAKEKRLARKKKERLAIAKSSSTFYDEDTKLMWQDNNDAKTVDKTWADAKYYCKNLSIAEYSDWRLPNYNELLSIVDYIRYKPAIKKGFKNVVSNYYWSSSQSVSNSSTAWYMYFYNGHTDYSHKSNKYYVRCVRGRQ